MSRNEIIISERILPKDILSGKIDHLIRISDKDKWTKNSIFQLKESFTSPTSIDIIIISSNLVKVIDIPLEILNRCGYKNQDEFKQQWENWFQDWDDNAIAWLIFFNIKSISENKNIEYEDMFA